MASGGRETSSMNGRVFLDTNVLVYLYDSDRGGSGATRFVWMLKAAFAWHG